MMSSATPPIKLFCGRRGLTDLQRHRVAELVRGGCRHCRGRAPPAWARSGSRRRRAAPWPRPRSASGAPPPGPARSGSPRAPGREGCPGATSGSGAARTGAAHAGPVQEGPHGGLGVLKAGIAAWSSAARAGSWATSPSQAARTGAASCAACVGRRRRHRGCHLAGSIPAAGRGSPAPRSRSGVSAAPRAPPHSRRRPHPARDRPSSPATRPRPRRRSIAAGSAASAGPGSRRRRAARRPRARRPVAVGEAGQPALAQPVAAARGARAQAGGGGEQLLDRTDPDQAGPGEGRVVDLVPAAATAPPGTPAAGRCGGQP